MAENITVIKRNGKIVKFDDKKISIAINAAATEVGNKIDRMLINHIISDIKDFVFDSGKNQISIEDIQKLVEDGLMLSGKLDIARAYIIYRAEHDKARESIDNLMGVYHDLTFSKSTDMDAKRDNANINSDSSMGLMLKYGSTASNYFADHYMLPKEFSKAHEEGSIHIHDKDFYYITSNCSQIDLEKLFDGGFSTGHGHIREPQEIRSYASLACIAIQANQNDQFGGQSCGTFDYAMAPGVRKTFKKEFYSALSFAFTVLTGDPTSALECFNQKDYKISFNNKEGLGDFFVDLFNKSKITDQKEQFRLSMTIYSAYEEAEKKTIKQTHQAMEAVVHNLNTMNSRAGAQCPFSSLNFGTDMSPEGRLVSEQLLLAQESGLGNGETPIFPILIFKMKSGINFNPEDPGYYLFKLAIRVSAKRLFPNFSNLDAPYNLKYYKPDHPETEVALMGCRTRVLSNDFDKTHEQSLGRGNIAFVSINLPKIALESDHDEKKFFAEFDKLIELCKRQLLHRFDILRKKHVYNYPFLMGQGVWIGSENLKAEDTIEEVLKQGSLSIGFVGLAECLIALIGKHQGESDEAQKLGLKIIGHLRDMTDKFTQQTGLNFSTFATPAENLAGRFARINQAKFGIVPGVTEKEYLTNSFHVPVYYKTTSAKKIDIEAPYHDLCNAGHITYVEMDGDPLNNLDAFEKVICYMHDKGIGYGSINHPVDRDPVCGYTGVIESECPHCHRKEVEHKIITVKRKG